MRILVIGDPHGNRKIFDIPLDNIDCVLIPGDLGSSNLARKYYFEYDIKQSKPWGETLPKEKVEEAFLEIVSTIEKILKHFDKAKIPTYWIHGNVEDTIDDRIEKYKLNVTKLSDMKFDNVKLINYKKSKFEDITFIGIPYFKDADWIMRFTPENEVSLLRAQKKQELARQHLKELGKADIVMMHDLPYGIMDKVRNPSATQSWQGKHAGSKILLDYIKKTEPKIVLCGHMHENAGMEMLGKTKIINVGSEGKYLIIDIVGKEITITKH
ncbi:MAG: metallophosphoesterase [Nanoarchaeota archaeon]|nr:metallophosphoesterase [Nanoarchaeota archaeon]